MEVFNVYPKEGKEFSMTFESFELKENEFIFFNAGSQPSNAAFVSFADVAAIIPEHQRFSGCFDPFQVYLRNRNKPIQIYAQAFDIGQKSTVTFYYENFGTNDLIEFENLYVSSEEVVAIFSSEGLARQRNFSTSSFPS